MNGGRQLYIWWTNQVHSMNSTLMGIYTTYNIAVHPLTDVLYCLLMNETICTVDRINGNLIELFVAEGSKYCLAIHDTDGTILVGDVNKPTLTKYTDKRQNMQTFRQKIKYCLFPQSLPTREKSPQIL